MRFLFLWRDSKIAFAIDAHTLEREVTLRACLCCLSVLWKIRIYSTYK